MSLALPKLLFVGGKGGVGKTTISSSLATLSAQGGEKTLLISTDPAHNLGDLFQARLGNEPVQLEGNLYALEIDPRAEVKRYIEAVARDTKRFLSPNSYAMMDNYYQSVARSGVAQESALFDRLIRVVVEDDSWDRIVIDTAPTGHTLRLFSLPKTLKEWSKTLLSEQERGGKMESVLGHLSDSSSNMMLRLEERYLRYTAFHNRLKDSKECGIIFVLNPEHLAIEETKRAIHSLHHEGLAPWALIVNKILPVDLEGFFARRVELQAHYLGEIETSFKGERIARVGLQAEDIIGRAGLEQVMEELARFLAT